MICYFSQNLLRTIENTKLRKDAQMTHLYLYDSSKNCAYHVEVVLYSKKIFLKGFQISLIFEGAIFVPTYVTF